MQQRVLLVLCAVAAVSLAQQGGQAPPPPFLQGASQGVIRAFEQLLSSSGGLTDEQLNKKVADFIGQQSSDIQSKFATFQARMKEAQAQGAAAHAAAIASFSPAAKAADAKLSAIADSTSLSVQQKSQQIDQLLGSLPDNVRQEILGAMQGN